VIGERELRLKLFGTTVRILVGGLPSGAHPVLAASGAAAILGRHQRALTRFEPDSELSRLNGDPAPVRVVSELTAGAVRAGLSAAQRSGGLVDPTLLGALEAAGYARSRNGAEPASLRDALRSAPERRPAGAASRPAWREVSVHGHEVRRPPGVRLDLGGTAKGLAADRAAALLAGHDTFAIDAGGDLVLGGRSGAPRTVAVADPLDAARVARFELAAGAVATSGIGTRVWRTETGFAHHLLDPATGLPAWTGVIQATALGGDCVEAELLAKTALLSGPARGAELLERNGGVLVLDDGEIVLAGALRERTRAAA
jgi:thiamine biosynthesis lipoprotein